MRLLKLLLVLLACAASLPAVAGPSDEADAAYERGDYATALRLYRPQAERGDTVAQYALGVMYEDGRGVPQDFATAVYWYRKAAERGDGAAQLAHGIMYHYSRGVPQDFVLAHMWTNLATTGVGKEWREKAIRNRDVIGAKMTPAQIAEAQKLAREWMAKRGR